MTSNQEDYELQQSNIMEILPKKSKYSVYRGLLLATFSAIFQSILSIILKQLSIHPGQMATYRYLALIFFSFPHAIKCKEHLLGPKNLRSWLLLRAISSSCDLFFYFFALKYLPLGEATAILSCSPIPVTMAGRIFLKEQIGKLQLVTVLMSVAGIFLITKVPQKLAGSSVTYTTDSVYGFISAAVSLSCATALYIIGRKLKSVHHSIQLFSFSWIGVLGISILTAIFGNFQMHNCGLQSIYIIAICIFGYISHVLRIMSLQCEMAGPVSTIRMIVNVGLAFMFQTLFCHEISDVYTSLGAVLILISGIFMGINKWLSSLSEDSKYRKKFGWIIKYV